MPACGEKGRAIGKAVRYCEEHWDTRETNLDQCLTLLCSHQWLQFRSRVCVDESSFRNNKQQDLGSGQSRQLVGLRRERQPYTAYTLNTHTFFMMPALRLLKVICRLLCNSDAIS